MSGDKKSRDKQKDLHIIIHIRNEKIESAVADLGVLPPLLRFGKERELMVTETFHMDVKAVGSDDGTHTYEIHRKWAEKGKKALVIELYPTLTASKCGSMDVSTMHLLNHVQELGWGEVRIVNLYSKVFSEKPKVSQLTGNDNNLSYLEEILEEKGIKEYDIVVAWGNTLTTHTQTIHAKADLLAMMKKKGLMKQVKCIATENMDTDGVHPLYLGLRHSKDVWKLKPYPLEKALQELNGGEEKAPAENGKKKKAVKEDVPENKEQA